ncbi:YciI family protein [Sphingomonas hengshuiensis]|uniref:GTP cyclohydrolase n=1 Tax=Sphingomonas hengshuiensis TaxID=1609977 RepID=A0A7U5CUG3_9SPHN|nr:YciI family protein [Sphingomonas hengshuiensis]AJP70637.1 GTP cyclohydrolase [Sphingomonas hengshuiensis]
MIVVLLNYVVDLAEIDALRPAHVDWLKAGLAEGRLLAAGRKVPVTGGMFLARGSLEEVQAWAATDPFALAGAAEYSFTEVAPSILAPGLEALAG